MKHIAYEISKLCQEESESNFLYADGAWISDICSTNPDK